MYYLKKDSADGRALIWKISLQTILHHPMGVGIGNFPGSYGQEQAAYFEAGKGTGQEEYVAGSPEYGFNEYLQVAVEHGWLPFILFLWIMGYSLYVGAGRKLFAATAPLLALLVAAVASYPFSVLPFLVVLSFLLAWIHSKPSTKTLCKVNYHLFTLLPLLIAALCLYNRYPTYNAYKQWGQSKFLYQAGAYENGARAYAPLYPLLADQPAFLFEYAQCLSKSGQHEESNSVLQKAVHTACDQMLYNVMGKNYQAVKQYAKAEACFRKAAHIVPNRIYPWYLLTKLYLETNEMEKAVKAANIVLTQIPKVESTAIKEMRNEIRKIIKTPD
jgi:tetratricopeptide (TPR) repeat protein